MALQFSEENFGQEVLQSDLPVFVDFYADWCGPCIMMGPIIDELSDDYQGILKVGKVNVDECPNLSSQYHVTNIPTFLLFKNGNIEETIVGSMTKDDFKSKIDPIL